MKPTRERNAPPLSAERSPGLLLPLLTDSEREMSAQEQDDITMTQEELADDVRWEESPGAPEERPRSRQATAAPVLAKRRYSITLSSVTTLYLCS